MLNQSFSESNIRKIRYKTIKKFKGTQKYDDFFSEQYAIIENKVKNNDFDFSNIKVSEIKKKLSYQFTNAAEELMVKKVNDNIKRLFKVGQSDRHSIIKQIISLCKDTHPFSVIRIDIKDFYESTSLEGVINYIPSQGLLSRQSSSALKSFKAKMNEMNIEGLPRGICLSSTLSELAIRNFDKKVRKIENIYYYARFVDDIIIFCIEDPVKTLEQIKNELINTGEKYLLNDKTYIYNAMDEKQIEISIDYLGYLITAKRKIEESSDSHRKVNVLISPKKITKIKNRLQKSLTSFGREKNFRALCNRVKFLAGNQYVIGDINRTKLKSGIYYNYPLINNRSQIAELDRFYQSLFKSKHSPISNAVDILINMGKKNNIDFISKIKNISFSFGYENKVINNFSYKENTKIKACW